MFLELHIFRPALKQVTRILNFNVSAYQSPNHQGVSSSTNMLVLCLAYMEWVIYGMASISDSLFCGCKTR